MKRSCGLIPTSLWDDELFLTHTAPQKSLYICLRSQPNLDAGALLPLTPRRWSRMLSAQSGDAVLADLDALAASHFIEADHAMDEVFVSGVFASEQIGAQPRRAAAAYEAINESFSKRLRVFALAELANEFAAAADRVPTGLRAIVLERDGYQCKACGWKPGTPVLPGAAGREIFRGLEIDHVYPRSRGGGNDLRNLQVLCTICNTLKGAKV